MKETVDALRAQFGGAAPRVLLVLGSGLGSLGDQIETILIDIPGAEDVSVEQVTGQPVLQIQLDQDRTDPCTRPLCATDRACLRLPGSHPDAR